MTAYLSSSSPKPPAAYFNSVRSFTVAIPSFGSKLKRIMKINQIYSFRRAGDTPTSLQLAVGFHSSLVRKEFLPSSTQILTPPPFCRWILVGILFRNQCVRSNYRRDNKSVESIPPEHGPTASRILESSPLPDGQRSSFRLHHRQVRYKFP